MNLDIDFANRPPSQFFDSYSSAIETIGCVEQKHIDNRRDNCASRDLPEFVVLLTYG